MIVIKDKKDCCGCQACLQCCPEKAISFIDDYEGFSYPEVNMDTCINCNLCETVCPILNQLDERQPQKVYASINKDENIRIKSSSGGLFSLLAEKILDDGGVVFGARFDDNWNVIHDFIEDKDKLYLFQGSKYVQSYIGNAFIQAKSFLNVGRKVLFSGTPCQIRGLKLFLKNDFDNLFTIDVICHGVPSPLVWKRYLDEKLIKKRSSNNYTIQNILFRDKRSGWDQFSFTIYGNNKKHDTTLYTSILWNDPYMRGFLQNLYLRPSCYACTSKSFKSGSDISLADYWGIQNVIPKFNDNKGVSLILILSKKGEILFSDINADSIETKYHDALKGNTTITNSVDINPNRDIFFMSLRKSNKTESIINKYSKLHIRTRIKLFFKKILIKPKV